MPQHVSGLLGRISRTFASFTPGQKAVSLLAVVGLLIGGVLFGRWATAPTYAPLFTNLPASDASAIVDQLNANGTPYQLSNGGSTILVPQGQVYDVRLAMSGKGLTPSADSGGWGLLDKQGVTSSEFQQQVAYRRALEGELTKTVGSLEGVTGAVVHLAIPQKDVFTKDTDKPKASVLVDTAPGRELSSAQVQAVVNLVAASVDGLDPADVTVADTSGRVLSAGADGSAGSLADGRAQQTRDYEDRVAASLQAMLDRVVGAGHSEVRITADLDFDRTKTTTESYRDSAAKPLAGSTTKETYRGGGKGAGGVLGGGVLGPDNIQVPAGGNGAAGRYEKTTETQNNALDRIVEVRESAPGAVRKLSVAVLLDTRKAGSINPTQVEELVASAVGLDPERGDSVVVDRMPFDAKAEKAAKQELEAARAAEATAARNDLLKTAGLVLVVLAVLAYAFLAARKRRTSVGLTPQERVQIEVLQRQLQAHADRAALDPAAAAPVALEAPSVDPQTELALVARSEIGELVKAQPEEVAALLRGWLADRRS